jgi:large subunit ribosomal protein L1
VPKILSKKEKAGAAPKGQNPQKNKKKDAPQKKRKARTMYKTYDLKDAEMFSLCDAMRYVSPPVPVPLPLLWIV